MKYDFKLFQELGWIIAVAVATAVFTQLLTFNPEEILDWRKWAIALFAGSVRATAAGVLNWLGRFRSASALLVLGLLILFAPPAIAQDLCWTTDQGQRICLVVGPAPQPTPQPQPTVIPTPPIVQPTPIPTVPPVPPPPPDVGFPWPEHTAGQTFEFAASILSQCLGRAGQLGYARCDEIAVEIGVKWGDRCPSLRPYLSGYIEGVLRGRGLLG